MRAAVFVERNKPLAVEKVTPLEPGPHDVVVRVDATGLCHSNLNIMQGLVAIDPPMILGHEGTGLVEATGHEVTEVGVGDRVIGSFVQACGTCWSCATGHSNLCTESATRNAGPRAVDSHGTSLPAEAGLGTFAELMTCHERSLVRVETDIPAVQLALIGCAVATGVGAALNTAQVTAGSTVVVIGCGGVGQAVIQGAKVAGAAQILAVDPVSYKRDSALQVGATHVSDGQGGLDDEVRSITRGRGADYAFEVTGRPELVLTALRAVGRSGTVVCVGLGDADAACHVPVRELVTQEKRLLGSYYGSSNVRRDFPRLVSLIEAGRLDIDAMVTKTIGLDDINAGFDSMRAGEAIRTVVAL